MVAMPMRQDCKYFESRTYANGDTVRKCDLDLAPEAPWRCPDDCPKFARRLADVNWAHGSLVTPETPKEPSSLGHDDSIAALLDAAEDIINDAAPDVLADLQQAQHRRSKKGVSGLKRRKGKRIRRFGGKVRAPKERFSDRLKRRYREGN
jgi:hypothetical protein